MHDNEQGETAEEERKSVRQKLVTCFETNLAARWETGLYDTGVCNDNQAKAGLTSKYYKRILCD